MKISVTITIEDYLYQFYQIGADVLNTTPEEMMAQAIFMYAGIVSDALENDTVHRKIDDYPNQ